MFKSATFKLTSWYLAIIIAISILFSMVIYTIATREVGTRFDVLQADPIFENNRPRYLSLRESQLHQAEANLIFSLTIANLCIWTIGGVGSYYLARRTLQPIEEAHEAQSRFVSDASHELRTPLASMKTELEVALRDPRLNPNEMRELLASNLEEVDKLTQLSQTLLQLSQLDTSPIASEKVNLPQALKTALKRFGKDGSRVVVSKSASSMVIANRLQLEELATILLDNALKYSPKTSNVDISFIKQKNMAGFEVTNEGKGITADTLPHIFDRFYQVDRSRTTSKQKGYGLGLALAKKIVELHHGELSVSSAPEGPTSFRVLLPKLRKDQAKNQN
jgi:signal transduction histidine kinase